MHRGTVRFGDGLVRYIKIVLVGFKKAPVGFKGFGLNGDNSGRF